MRPLATRSEYNTDCHSATPLSHQNPPGKVSQRSSNASLSFKIGRAHIHINSSSKNRNSKNLRNEPRIDIACVRDVFTFRGNQSYRKMRRSHSVTAASLMPRYKTMQSRK